MNFIHDLITQLRQIRYFDRKLVVELDDRELTGGERSWYWIKKGIPVRLEIGPRDVKNNSVFMGRRDFEPKEKKSLTKSEFIDNIVNILDEIHNNLYQRALDFRKENIKKIDDKDEFYKFFTPKNKKNPEIHGGFAYSHWCGSPECEASIKEDLKVTIRNIPLDSKEEEGFCIYCGKKSHRRVYFAKSY